MTQTRAKAYDREKSLDAALEIFWHKGYHATSMRDLEDVLTMKPGSIYAAFKSKENLYMLAIERYFERGYRGFLQLMNLQPSPLGALTEYMRQIESNSQADGACAACMLMKTVIGTTSDDAAIRKQAQDYLDQLRETFAEAFTKAKEVGEIRADVDVAQEAAAYQSQLLAIRVEAGRETPAPVINQMIVDYTKRLDALRS